MIIDGVDHSNKPSKPLIAPVPFSLSASTNRLLEESFAINKAERKQQVVESFNAKIRAKMHKKM